MESRTPAHHDERHMIDAMLVLGVVLLVGIVAILYVGRPK